MAGLSLKYVVLFAGLTIAFASINKMSKFEQPARVNSDFDKTNVGEALKRNRRFVSLEAKEAMFRFRGAHQGYHSFEPFPPRHHGLHSGSFTPPFYTPRHHQRWLHNFGKEGPHNRYHQIHHPWLKKFGNQEPHTGHLPHHHNLHHQRHPDFGYEGPGFHLQQQHGCYNFWPNYNHPLGFNSAHGFEHDRHWFKMGQTGGLQHVTKPSQNHEPTEKSLSRPGTSSATYIYDIDVRLGQPS